MVRFIEDSAPGDALEDGARAEPPVRTAENAIKVDFFEEDAPPPARPSPLARWPGWHVRVVGGVSLPWNMVGALDYAMSEFRNEAYLAQSARQMGVSAFDLSVYIGSLPAWAVAAWAFGTWGAVTGSMLLLARERLAVIAFAVSLAGLALFTLYRGMTEQPEWASPNPIFSALVWSVAAALLAYSEWARRKGWLSGTPARD